MWENCQDKWMKIFELKEKQKDAVIPKGKEEGAADYQGKWSDANSGQAKFGGWAPESYERLEELMDTLDELRQTDEANDKPMQKYVLEVLRAKKGIEDAAPGGKKKKRSKGKAPPQPVAKKLKRRSE